jgi:hypothetical protein
MEIEEKNGKGITIHFNGLGFFKNAHLYKTTVH